MNSPRGGARPGSGRPPVEGNLRRILVTVRLPAWILERLGDLPVSRTYAIIEALCSHHGWTAPEKEE